MFLKQKAILRIEIIRDMQGNVIIKKNQGKKFFVSLKFHNGECAQRNIFSVIHRIVGYKMVILNKNVLV